MFSAPKSAQPYSRNKLMTCIMLNQLATPGLGSWLVGYRIAGAGQMLMAVAGFGLVTDWFLRLMSEMLATFGSAPVQESAHPASWLWQAGVILFVMSWLWAGITSLAIYRLKPTQPPIIKPGRF